MKELKLKAMAKINLGLDVLRRRADGYHDLRMIMQSVCLYDQLKLKRQFYARVEEYDNRKSNRNDVDVSGFFSGVNTASSLKKRYKDLIKIFHPDNLSGDTVVIQKINREYQELKKSMAV